MTGSLAGHTRVYGKGRVENMSGAQKVQVDTIDNIYVDTDYKMHDKKKKTIKFITSQCYSIVFC
jgi:hypothetical protein